MTTSGEDLLVFGYSCKLFRNDEVASAMDQGKYLIPWNSGDAIDRYDGRATMHDVQPFEADDVLSPEEKAVEEMCDEERYRALKIKEKPEEGIEETASHPTGGGAAIGFDYSEEPASVPDRQPEQPSLKTLANVLEKTAEFIASQGAQMEILMRAKEASNLKFQFLNPDNSYHPIYKQVLEKKRAKFKNPYLVDSGQLKQLSIEEVEASLRELQRNLPSAAPGATFEEPTNAYSKLVEKIKEQKKAAEVSNPATPTPSPPPTPAPPPEDKSDEVQVDVPPMELQMLIDRTASYVCRQNLEFGQQKGAEKIAVVKKLQKDKFSFLFPENKYNTYYLFKVALYTEMLEKEQASKRRKLASNSEQQMQELTIKTFPTLKGFFNT